MIKRLKQKLKILLNIFSKRELIQLMCILLYLITISLLANDIILMILAWSVSNYMAFIILHDIKIGKFIQSILIIIPIVIAIIIRKW